jgi:hypothetical protein
MGNYKGGLHSHDGTSAKTGLFVNHHYFNAIDSSFETGRKKLYGPLLYMSILCLSKQKKRQDTIIRQDI